MQLSGLESNQQQTRLVHFLYGRQKSSFVQILVLKLIYGLLAASLSSFLSDAGFSTQKMVVTTGV